MKYDSSNPPSSSQGAVTGHEARSRHPVDGRPVAVGGVEIGHAVAAGEAVPPGTSIPRSAWPAATAMEGKRRADG